jgi:hypothetical protein
MTANEQPVTTTDDVSETVAAAQADPRPTTITVTVAGGRDGLQGVQVLDPTTGAIYRPGATVEVSAHLAEQWIANGWVVETVDSTEPGQAPTTPGRRSGRQRSTKG